MFSYGCKFKVTLIPLPANGTAEDHSHLGIEEYHNDLVFGAVDVDKG